MIISLKTMKDFRTVSMMDSLEFILTYFCRKLLKKTLPFSKKSLEKNLVYFLKINQ